MKSISKPAKYAGKEILKLHKLLKQLKERRCSALSEGG